MHAIDEFIGRVMQVKIHDDKDQALKKEKKERDKNSEKTEIWNKNTPKVQRTLSLSSWPAILVNCAETCSEAVAVVAVSVVSVARTVDGVVGRAAAGAVVAAAAAVVADYCSCSILFQHAVGTVAALRPAAVLVVAVAAIARLMLAGLLAAMCSIAPFPACARRRPGTAASVAGAGLAIAPAAY